MLPRALRFSFVFALGLLASLSLDGCSERVAPPEPPVAIRRGDEAFTREDYDPAIQEYRIYTDSLDQGVYTPRALYKSALASYRLGHYVDCLHTLDDLAARYPSTQWVQADALRGDCQRDLGHRIPAVAAWDNGWSVATDVDRPKLRKRIIAVLADDSNSELTETEGVVEQHDVRKLVHHEMDERNLRKSGEPGAVVVASAEQSAPVPPPAAEPEPVVQPVQAVPPVPPVPQAAPEQETGLLTVKVDGSSPKAHAAAQPPPASRSTNVEGLAKIDSGEDFSTEIAPPPAPAPVAAVSAPIARVEVEPTEDLAPGGARVGCIIPLTGNDRDVGEHVLRGLRLVFGDSSDRLVIRDTGSNPAMAARLLKLLAEDETIMLVIAAIGAQEGSGLANVANEVHTPLFLLSDDAGLNGNYIMQVRSDSGQSKADAVRALLQHVMAESKLTQFAVLSPDTAEGIDLTKLFRAEVGRRGGKVIASEKYDAKAVGVPISSISEWHAKGVQGIFVPDDAAKVAAIARVVQAEEPALWLLGVHGWESPGTRAGAFNGIVFAGGTTPPSADRRAGAFVERYRRAYDSAPNSRDVQAYDAGIVAKGLLGKGVSSRNDVFTNLDSLGVMEGAVSELSVNHRALRRDPLLLHFRDGQVEPVASSHSAG